MATPHPGQPIALVQLDVAIAIQLTNFILFWDQTGAHGLIWPTACMYIHIYSHSLLPLPVSWSSSGTASSFSSSILSAIPVSSTAAALKAAHRAFQVGTASSPFNQVSTIRRKLSWSEDFWLLLKFSRNSGSSSNCMPISSHL